MRLRISEHELGDQLRRIDLACGQRLFVNTRQGISPTDMGHHVINYAKEMLDGFGPGRSAGFTAPQGAGFGPAQGATYAPAQGDEFSPAQDDSIEMPAPIRVGGVSGVLVPLLTETLGDMLTDRLVSSTMQREISVLCQMLQASTVDVAVLHEFVGHPVDLPRNVAEQSLLVEPTFIALSESHRLARLDEVPLSELAQEDWAMPASGDASLHTSFREACARAGFEPRLTHWTIDSAAAFALVARGHTVAGMYPTAVPAPGTVLRPLKDNPHPRRVFIAWPATSPVAGHIPRACAAVLDAYYELMRQRPHFDLWWRLQRHDTPPRANYR